MQKRPTGPKNEVRRFEPMAFRVYLNDSNDLFSFLLDDITRFDLQFRLFYLRSAVLLERKTTCEKHDALFKQNSKSDCIANVPHATKVMWRALIGKMNDPNISMNGAGEIRMVCFDKVVMILTESNHMWHKTIENPDNVNPSKILQMCGPII